MKVVLLAGGTGSRLAEETETKPKPIAPTLRSNDTDTRQKREVDLARKTHPLQDNCFRYPLQHRTTTVVRLREARIRP